MKPLLISLLFIAPLCAQTVDLSAFGGKPDGTTDNTTAFNNAFAFATAHMGTEIDLSCGAAGSYYVIRSPITFPGYTKIKGSHGYGCQIVYSPTNGGNAAYAFSLVNSKFTTLQDLALVTEPNGAPQRSSCSVARMGTPACIP